MEPSIDVKVLILYVRLEIFNQEVKELALAIPDEDWKKYEFIRVLGGGNVEFPKQVIEVASQKLFAQLPEYK